MLTQRLHLFFWCISVSLFAFVILNFWNDRNAPLYRKFESKWAQDVQLLESSKKVHPGWFETKEIEIIGGTPETKAWLKRIQAPLKPKKEKDGSYKLEILTVAWEEEGKRGALVQYNLVDLKTQNMVWELGRTLILSQPKDANPFQAFLEDLRQ